MKPDAETMKDVISRIVEAARPLRIILFGSASRGEMGPDSDVDLLVVVPEGTHRRKTAQDLHQKMVGVKYPVEFVVATPSDLEKHRDNPGLIYSRALREGKELYAA